MFKVRTMVQIAAIVAACLSTTAPAQAHEYKAGDLIIDHPWTRATPAGAEVAAGYAKFTNHGAKPDRLIEVTAEGAKKVELHQMTMVNNVMTMREVTGGLEIKPGETVELEPGGYHMMMMGLKAPFKQGETIKGTLKFENAGTVPIEFKVEAIAAERRPAAMISMIWTLIWP